MTDEVIVFGDEIEQKLKDEFGEKATPDFINMLRLGKAAFEHGYQGFITKDKVLEWVGQLYESGMQERRGMTHQNKLRPGSEDILNSAEFLAYHGPNKGYLSKQEE